MKIFEIAACFVVCAFVACSKPETPVEIDRLEAREQISQEIKIGPALSPAKPSSIRLEGNPKVEPFNCPVKLIASSNLSKKSDQRNLRFFLNENLNFDPDRGDACQGDLKNLWFDFRRFESEIEDHMPDIKGITGFSLHNASLPITDRELKTFIDLSAKQNSLEQSLGEIDRYSLEGKMQFDREIHLHINMALQSYWLKEHAPIIEHHLSTFDLRMERFGFEKYAYCFHPYELCGGSDWGVDREFETEYDLEYRGSPFSSFSFKRVQ